MLGRERKHADRLQEMPRYLIYTPSGPDVDRELRAFSAAAVAG